MQPHAVDLGVTVLDGRGIVHDVASRTGNGRVVSRRHDTGLTGGAVEAGGTVTPPQPWRPIGLAGLSGLAILAGLLTGGAAVLFRAVVALIHNIAFFGEI